MKTGGHQTCLRGISSITQLAPTRIVVVLVSFREHLLGVSASVVGAGAGCSAQSPRSSVYVCVRPSNSPHPRGTSSVVHQKPQWGVREWDHVLQNRVIVCPWPWLSLREPGIALHILWAWSRAGLQDKLAAGRMGPFLSCSWAVL